MTFLAVPTTVVIEPVRNLDLIHRTRVSSTRDKVVLAALTVNTNAECLVQVADESIVICSHLLPVVDTFLLSLHVGDDAVARRTIVGVGLKLEWDVVDIIEGDIMEELDEIMVRNFMKLRTQLTTIVTACDFDKIVNGNGKGINSITNKMDVRLLGLMDSL